MDILVGATIGLAQVAVGHPFDTVKTLMQNNQPYKNMALRSYYRGWGYPTISSVFFNSIAFPVYGRCYKDNKNAYVSGAISGLAVSPCDYVFSVGKIRRQTQTTTPLHTRGMPISVLRTSMAMSVYFGTYEDLKPITGPFLAGCFSGLANWTLTYPLDVISTRQIANDVPIMQTIGPGLWRGFLPCAVRAVLVNGVSFKLYNDLSNIL